MKPFMDKDFLLSTDTARTLFHEIAEKMPVLYLLIVILIPQSMVFSVRPS